MLRDQISGCRSPRHIRGDPVPHRIGDHVTCQDRVRERFAPSRRPIRPDYDIRVIAWFRGQPVTARGFQAGACNPGIWASPEQ